MRFFARLSCCLTLLLTGCAAPTPQPELCPIVAHRGASQLAPENTLAGFTLAWELGADRIEGDFYLTSDGEVVALHDLTTAETAVIDVAVQEQTLARFKTNHAVQWKVL